MLMTYTKTTKNIFLGDGLILKLHAHQCLHVRLYVALKSNTLNDTRVIQRKNSSIKHTMHYNSVYNQIKMSYCRPIQT